MRSTIFCITLAVASLAQAAQAAEATIAVAANFAAPAKVLAESFTLKTDHDIKLVTSSSGKIYSQVSQGAPFDAFLSADQLRPQKLAEQGLAAPPVTYAIGRLVLWAPGHDLSPLSAGEDVSVAKSSEHNSWIAKALRQMPINKVAIANPRLAPYGLAAQEVLAKLKLSRQFLLIRGESISQAYQFVHSGNAEMGFVAQAQLAAHTADKGTAHARGKNTWLVPGALHAPIKQDAVLLKRGQNNEAAKAFMAFLASAQARAIIERFGYSMPPLPL